MWAQTLCRHPARAQGRWCSCRVQLRHLPKCTAAKAPHRPVKRCSLKRQGRILIACLARDHRKGAAELKIDPRCAAAAPGAPVPQAVTRPAALPPASSFWQSDPPLASDTLLVILVGAGASGDTSSPALLVQCRLISSQPSEELRRGVRGEGRE